ncbi:YfhO family protein [Chloroflexota bacterium]
MGKTHVGRAEGTRLRNGAPREALAYLACLLSPLLFFGRPLIQGRMLVTGDLLIQLWPYRDLWATYVRSGVPPLWNPYLFSGMPFLGEPQFATLYPLNALLLVLPSLTASQLQALLNFSLLAAFTFYYVRAMNRSRLAGLCAALSLAYGLYAVIHFTHLTLLQCALWLPLLLGLTERLVTTRRRRYAVLIAVALAFQVYSGHPQTLFYSSLILGAYLLLHMITARDRRGQLFAYMGIAVLVGVLLSAIQILPSLELALYSTRAAMSYQQFSEYSLRPVMLVQAIFPFLFGSPSSSVYSTGPFVMGWDWEQLFYTGAVTVVCVLSITAVRRIAGWREVFWWLVLAWGLVFALGAYTPIYRYVYQIPVYNWFRVAGRHLFPACVAVSVLTGLRLDRVLSATRREMVITYGTVLVTAVLLVGLSLGREGDALRAAYGSRIIRPELVIPALMFMVIAVTLWPFGYGSHRQRTGFRVILVALVCADLLLTSATTMHSLSPSSAKAHRSEYQELARTTPGDGRRFWYLPAQITADSNLFLHLPFATSYNPLIVGRYAELGRFIGPTPVSNLFNLPQAAAERVLDLLDVGYLLLPRSLGSKPILDDSCSFQLEEFCFPELGRRLELPAGRELQLSLPPGRITGIGLISALGYSAGIPDRSQVAELVILGEDGQIDSHSVQTGVHTAEWAADCLPPEQELAHSTPPVARSWDSVRQDAVACEGHTYFATFDLETSSALSGLVIRNSSDIASLLLDGLSVRLEQGRTMGYALASALYGTLVPLQEPDRLTANYAVYDRAPAWGHAWAVERVRSMDSASFLEALHGAAPGLDLGSIAYVDQQDLPGYLQGFPELLNTSFDPEASVEWTALDPNTMRIDVKASGPAFVVVSEVYYPGWQARVEDQEAIILRVDHALRGVVVPAGGHTVVLEYHPLTVYWGAALGALGILLALGFLLLPLVRGKRREALHRKGAR